MLPIKQFVRLFIISRVCIQYRLDELADGLPNLPLKVRLIRWLQIGLFFGARVPKDMPRGERIRLALETLGPVFIKLGQMLSTRPDLLPPDIADELKLLQDKVPPFPGSEARQLIESELGKPVAELFAEFDETPLASASIAQVHAATLHSGEKVVAKVVRPDIEKVIARDLALMYMMARIAMRTTIGRRLRPLEVVKEYDHVIHNELDMMYEAGNAALLKHQFVGDPIIHVPEIHWDYTRDKVVVMERIFGTQITEVDKMVAAGVDFKVLAERGVEIFFTQLFKNNFFHADMHPGNIFVDISDPKDPKYAAIDFGIVGSIDNESLNYLAQNFLAFFARDYRRIAELHVESGWVAAGTSIEQFAGAVRTACEPNINKPIKDISFGQFLLRLFDVGRQYQMEIQPQLVLLQKTLFNIEGLGRRLYPDLNLWDTAKPFLENWAKDQLSVSNNMDKAKELLPRLPELADRLMTMVERNRPPTDIRDELLALRAEMQQDNQRRLYGTAASLAFIVAVAIAFFGDANASAQFKQWWGQPWPVWVLSFSGLVLWFKAFKRSR